MDLVAKLTHSIKSVRERAWGSLLFKYEHGLLPDGFLGSCDVALAAACAAQLSEAPSTSTSPSTSTTDLDVAAIARLLARLVEANPFLQFDSSRVPPHLLPQLPHHHQLNPSQKRGRSKPIWSAEIPGPPQKNIHNLNSRIRSLSANKSRSRSPVKLVHGGLTAPSLARFPVLPYAIQTYNYIHLSPVDDEAVADFILFIQQPMANDDAELKLFHILLNDFGSEIFLQKPQLFRLILAGLESESPQRASQSQIYISKLVLEWSNVFRRFIDGPASLSSRTPISTTPNVSITAGGAYFGGGIPYTSTGQPIELPPDSSISIPYACHEIHFTLCRLMSEGNVSIQCLDILTSIVPLVVLHLETVKLKTSTKSNHADLLAVLNIDDFCCDYVAAVLPCICYIASSAGGSVVAQEEKAAWKEKFVEFISELVKSFQLISINYTDLQWRIATSLLNLPTLTHFPMLFLRTILPSINLNSAISLLPLLTHLHTSTRLAGYKELISHLDDPSHRNTVGAHSFLANPTIQYTIVKTAYHDENAEIRSIARKVAKWGLELSAMAASSSFWMDWVQLFSDEDDLSWIWDSEKSYPDRISFWVKGLYHRSDRVREFCFNEMVARFPKLKSDSAFADAVVFNQSILSMNPEQDLHLYETRVGTFDLSELMTELRNSETPTMDILITGLERLSTAIYDATMMARAKDMQLLKLLLTCLIETRVWFSRGQALLHVLKICRIIAALSMGLVSEIATEDVITKLVKPEYLFNSNEFIRYEYSKLLFLFLFNHHRYIHNVTHRSALGIIDNGSIYLFDMVPQKYFVYLVNEVFSLKAVEGMKVGDDVGEALGQLYNGYIGFKFEDANNPVKVWMDGLFRELKDSKCHEQFQGALDSIFACVLYEEDYNELPKYALEGLLNRFLVTHPANYADEQLLATIIRHLEKCIRKSREFYNAFKEILFRSLSNLILPILQNATQGKTAGFDVVNLASELIFLLKAMVKRATIDDLSRMFKTTNCMEVVINYTYHIFSQECKDVRSYSNRVNCLETMVVFAQFPDFVHITSGEIGTLFIQLLVSVIGFSQQNHVNSTDGNAFTYQDRSIYRLVARTLRNVSRCFVVLQSSYKNWLWGDHWLFEGDVEWLLALLNDDERIIQKYGLGILGNLILIKNSYPLLCLKMPQFLDMAFLYVLDFERNYTLRKEALLIINNFLITFCHDNKISQVALLPTSDESLAEIDMEEASRQLNSPDPYNKISELLELFEHCGFFEQLRALVADCEKYTIVYMDALTGLLLNLCILSPQFMHQKLCDLDTWTVLFNFLGTLYLDEVETDETSSSSSNFVGGGGGPLLLKFRKNQFRQCYSHFIESVECNVLNLVRVIMAENSLEMTQQLLGTTSLLDHLKGLVNDAAARNKANEPLFLKSTTVVFHIVSDVLQLIAVNATLNLGLWLQNDDTGIKILELCCLAFEGIGGIQGADSDELLDFKKVGCLLLSRLLALQYSGIMNISIEQYLSVKSDRYPDCCIGASTIVFLLQMISAALDEMDLTYIEAMRICFQCLLSKFEPAKEIAISNGVVENLVGRIDTILKGSKQEIGYSRGIYKSLNEALHLQDLNEPLMLETLHCLQNSIAHCHHPVSLLEKHTKTNSSVVDVVRRIMKEQTESEAIFFTSLNILKIMVLQTEIRVALIKTIFLADILITLQRLAKEKEIGKVINMLGLLRNFTFHLDGQNHAIKSKGL
ncbi:hypothetical protein HDU79_006827 [Rhizoclosmatium sp. JEL0117]|nr:hypothetical protein HDU79_006827 [Rhizoclosmatium sp. JEL0117]